MWKELLKAFFDFLKKAKEAFTPKKLTKAPLIKLGCLVVAIILLFGATVVSLSAAITASQKDDIVEIESLSAPDSADCILVFGALVRADGTLSDMLRDRVITGVELYKKGLSKKIIMSGDSEHSDYDETGAMKRFAIELGVPEGDIICDRYGLSTYDSVWRAKNVYGMKTMLIVTQEYHLYRALYICEKLSLSAKGVCADLNTYGGQLGRDIREIAARAKDFFFVLTKAKPLYIGE